MYRKWNSNNSIYWNSDNYSADSATIMLVIGGLGDNDVYLIFKRVNAYSSYVWIGALV